MINWHLDSSYEAPKNMVQLRSEVGSDLYSKLLEDRVIYLDAAVDEQSSSVIITALLHLDKESSEDIYLYINSPGGSVYHGLAIYDTMRFLRSDVATVAMGYAASMGAFLLAGGVKGKRFVLPNARVMIHELSGGSRGRYEQLEDSFKESKILEDVLEREMAANTGQSMKRIKKDFKHDTWFSAKEAVAYGLADRIIDKRPK